MPGPYLTFATAPTYLLGLGRRFLAIGRSELTYTGEASGTQPYPLLLVEGDPQGSELIGQGGQPTGQDSFTFAVHVLTKGERTPTDADLAELLQQTNDWADCLTEQLRQERPGQLVSVSKLCLPGQAGSDLACGWRVELVLKLAKNLNRQTNATLFTPEVL